MENPPQVSPSAQRGSLACFQELIEQMYGQKDHDRGVAGTFMYFMEEVGELATALRRTDAENLQEEFADVLAWLVTLANLKGVDLTGAIEGKYGEGCPGCQALTCQCNPQEKP